MNGYRDSELRMFVKPSPSARHARAWPGTTRLCLNRCDVVDGRAGPGHDDGQVEAGRFAHQPPISGALA
jgi:hypothetical protein